MRVTRVGNVDCIVGDNHSESASSRILELPVASFDAFANDLQALCLETIIGLVERRLEATRNIVLGLLAFQESLFEVVGDVATRELSLG